MENFDWKSFENFKPRSAEEYETLWDEARQQAYITDGEVISIDDKYVTIKYNGKNQESIPTKKFKHTKDLSVGKIIKISVTNFVGVECIEYEAAYQRLQYLKKAYENKEIVTAKIFSMPNDSVDYVGILIDDVVSIIPRDHFYLKETDQIGSEINVRIYRIIEKKNVIHIIASQRSIVAENLLQQIKNNETELNGKNDIYIIDTNVFIDCPDIIGRLIHQSEILNEIFQMTTANIVIPATVVEELDLMKVKLEGKNKKNAQAALREIKEWGCSEQIKVSRVYPYLIPQEYNRHSGDNKILSVGLSCKKNNGNPIILSSDNGMIIKAKAQGLGFIALKDFLARFDLFVND